MKNNFIRFNNELVCISKVGGLKITDMISNGEKLFNVSLTDLNDKQIKHFISTRDEQEAKRVFEEVAEKLGYIEI